MHGNHRSPPQQRRVAKYAQEADADHFINLFTGPELYDTVESQLPEHRERKYPPTVTLSMFLGQAMSADGSCQNAVIEAIVNRLLSALDVGSVNTAGYCFACKRLPMQMVRALTRQTGELLGMRTPTDWLWQGRHVKLVDGTTVLMPDTEENQMCYPQYGGQAPGVGFPIARLVGVISLSCGAVLDVAMGPYKGKGTGEYGLFLRVKESFIEGDIMLADSYFCSYFPIADMQARGVDVLFEQHGARNTDFRRGKRLGKRDHLVCWTKPKVRPGWMSLEDYHCYPAQITVRETKVGIKVLVTTLLGPRETAKMALGELYLERWHVELDFRNIKTTLGMETLSCKTPDMCKKEMWVHLLAYNLIRLLMAEAALQTGVLPRQLSFKHTLQIWTAWSQRQFLSDGGEDTANWFRAIAQIRVGNRAGRLEPSGGQAKAKAISALVVPSLESSCRHQETRAC